MAIGSPQWMYKSGEAYELEQSLKFNDDDSAYLSWTPASASNQKTWTWSAWVKRGNLDTEQVIFGGGTSGTNNCLIRFNSDNTLRFHNYVSSFQWNLTTSAVYRDTSSWYNIIAVADTSNGTSGDRVRLYVNGQRVTAFGTETYPSQNYDGLINSSIEHTLAKYPSASSYQDGYLSEVNFIDGSAKAPADFGETGDYGEWKPKQYSGSYGNNGFYLPFKQDYTVEGFSTVTYKGTGANNYIGGTGFNPDLVWIKNRTTAGANHLLFDKVRTPYMGEGSLRSDSTAAESTALDELSGVSTDGFTVAHGGDANGDGKQIVAWNWDMGADTPTGFGCVTYRGNGSTRSISGMGFKPDLTWIKNRDTTDWHQLTDSVRGVDKQIFPNATDAGDNATNKITSFDTDGFSLGSHESVNTNTEKYIAWGWDMGGTSVANTTGDINTTVMANPTYGQSIVAWTGTGSGSSPTVGHGLSSAPELVIVKHTDAVGAWPVQHAYDTTKYFQFQDVDAASTGATVFDNTAPTNSVFTINATNAVTNQSGGDYIAYCFHSVSGYSKIGTYTGNGSATGPSVTTGFRPAFLLIKNTASTHGWQIYDSTRNPINPVNNMIVSDTNGAEVSNSSDYKVDFTSTGFQVKTADVWLNENSETMIYMAFAGGMDSISDYNTDGSIDSRVKANPTYGQSIVSYTGNGTSGATVGHGLSSTPEVVLVKSRNNGWSWEMYHSGVDASYPQNYTLELDSDGARVDNTGYWNDTAPTSSVFSLGNNTSVNKSDGSGTYIAYCWHSVTGYSKFGSYTGNGNATGPSVTCGFKPAFVMFKNASSAGNLWAMYDNTRNPTNRANLALAADSTAAEANYPVVDFDANGFQIHNVYGFANDNGDTYIYMAFADKREYAYWLDQSGNNNDWTSNNLTESDISVDSPTNNFATYNPLHAPSTGTFSEGNLKHAAGGQVPNISSMAMSSGKWYAEFYCVSGSYTRVGIANESSTGIYGGNLGGTSGSWAKINNTPRLYHNNAGGSYGEDWDAGDICMVAFDADAGKIWYGVNGVWDESGNPATAANPSQSSVTGTDFFFATTSGSGTLTYVVNFGQDSSFAGNKTAQGNQDGNEIGDFYYTPPTGFLALCTSNLPAVAVTPSEHFNTVLYTGTGSELAVSGAGFQPDFTWTKSRSNALNHNVYDAIRGATKMLKPNLDVEEGTDAQSLKSFDSDGFTVGTDSHINTNGATFVSWNWKANGSGSAGSNLTGVGSCTVSANVDSGFSIAEWTSTQGGPVSYGHGLSQTPEMVITKSVTDTDYWSVGHKELGWTKALNLNDRRSPVTSSAYWNNTAPTSTIVTLGGQVNNNKRFICYNFHSVEGYQGFGKYAGNQNEDGPFVYLGFRPAFLMIFSITTQDDGHLILDSTREPNNRVDLLLYTNNSDAEADNSGTSGTTSRGIDFLSNGFKIRGANSLVNYSSRDYAYWAIAETPFKNSNAR